MIQIVETPADIKSLDIIDPSKLVYLTQTTLSTDDAEIIIDALQKAFPEINSPPSDDICYATTNRQTAVREEAPDADLVLVVGSQNSSNSLRLTEISKSVGTPSFLVDDVTMVNPDWLEGVQNILITAGASAPERLVTEIIHLLTETFDGHLVEDSPVDEGMTFSLPPSLATYLQEKDVTVEGNMQ